MSIAYITFSKEGLNLANALKQELGGDIYLHQQVPGKEVFYFKKVKEVTKNIWNTYSNIVFIGASGIAVRSITTLLTHKSKDPAVVVVDIGGRFVISLIGGHEAGGNNFAYLVASSIGAIPIITTSSEAHKDIVVGIGCRKNTPLVDLKEALFKALEQVHIPLNRVRHLATLDLKKQEKGLLELAQELNLPLLFLKKERLLSCPYPISTSQFVLDKVGVPGVAEPACLLTAHNPKLILRRMVWKNTTIALAQEQFLWWE